MNRRPLRPEQRPPMALTRTLRHRRRTEAPFEFRWEPLRDLPEQDRLPNVSHRVMDGWCRQIASVLRWRSSRADTAHP
jgi:hypothetical protein